MSTLRPSYGFSALFEAMDIAVRRENSENTITDFAVGAMESSLLGDEVLLDLGISDDIPESADDYDNLDETDIENDEDLKKLDNTLDNIVEGEEDEESLNESFDLIDGVLESIIEKEYYGGY